MNFPLRCPSCNALVVDRRSPTCTTCRVALPAEMVMTRDQTKRVNTIDLNTRNLHREELRKIGHVWKAP